MTCCEQWQKQYHHNFWFVWISYCINTILELSCHGPSSVFHVNILSHICLLNTDHGGTYPSRLFLWCIIEPFFDIFTLIELLLLKSENCNYGVVVQSSSVKKCSIFFMLFLQKYVIKFNVYKLNVLSVCTIWICLITIICAASARRTKQQLYICFLLHYTKLKGIKLICFTSCPILIISIIFMVNTIIDSSARVKYNWPVFSI